MNKNRKQKLGLLLTCLLLCMSLIACKKAADFDAAGYVKGYLDTCMKGEGTTYAELCNVDTKETDELYNTGIEDLANAYLSGVELSKESKKTVTDALKHLLKQTKYTVSKAEKNKDGSFSVSVETKPLIIELNQSIMTDLSKEATDKYYGEYEETSDKSNESSIDYDKYYEIFCKDFSQYINELAVNPEYGDPISVTVTISENNQKYAMSQNDQNKLFKAILDTSQS